MSVDDLKAINFSQLSDRLLTLLTDPTSNLQAALILYGMIALLVLIVLIAGIVVLSGLPDDEDEEPDFDGSVVAPGAAEGVVLGAGSEGLAPAERQEPSLPPLSPFVTIAMIASLVVAVWVVTGFTTSTNAACGACHVSTVHSDAKKGADPHSGADCVSCHEPSGGFGRYVTDVPSRVLHVVEGATGQAVQADYGRITSSACSNCHTADIARVTVNQETGVRMSHKEPLAASARCVDCHEPKAGAVTLQTVGMGSCLRCHDAVTAPSECTTCHDKQAAAAARARTTKLAKSQVTDVQCGGCHDEKTECDSCHGARMPHTLAFKAGLHARAGAADFWFNGGQTCAGSDCHTATRRPCTKCHTPILGKGHPITQAKDHQTATVSACRCHNFMGLANPRNRDFCQLCHSEAALKESAR